MEKHKIRNIDIDICCCEEKATYNLLFNWCLNEHDKNDVLKYVKDDIKRQSEGKVIYPNKDYKKYDTDYIYDLFVNNYDRYKNENCPIFGTYEAIGKFFKEGME